MTSNINPINIHGNYPVAGQDNDSQGFRDNFTNIQNNFSIASSEISNLQANVATIGSNVTNFLYGAKMFTDLGPLNNTVSLDYAVAQVQKVTTQSPGIFVANVVNWPAAVAPGKYAELTLIANIADPSHTLSFPTSIVTSGTAQLAGLTTGGGKVQLSFPAAGVYEFRLSTVDGGNSVNLEDLTRAKIAVQNRIPANIGAVGDTVGSLAVGSGNLYVCTGAYNGTTAIWKYTSLTSF